VGIAGISGGDCVVVCVGETSTSGDGVGVEIVTCADFFSVVLVDVGVAIVVVCISALQPEHSKKATEMRSPTMILVGIVNLV